MKCSNAGDDRRKIRDAVEHRAFDPLLDFPLEREQRLSAIS